MKTLKYIGIMIGAITLSNCAALKDCNPAYGVSYEDPKTQSYASVFIVDEAD
jgi:hypothetical protein